LGNYGDKPKGRGEKLIKISRFGFRFDEDDEDDEEDEEDEAEEKIFSII
jgi:hypothetical protein